MKTNIVTTFQLGTLPRLFSRLADIKKPLHKVFTVADRHSLYYLLKDAYNTDKETFNLLMRMNLIEVASKHPLIVPLFIRFLYEYSPKGLNRILIKDYDEVLFSKIKDILFYWTNRDKDNKENVSNYLYLITDLTEKYIK